MILSPRFQQSLDYACIVHAGHVRKGTQIPYVSHLLAVAGLSLEYGANEDQAIAALLHDAVEDAGGKPRLEDIRLRFGDAVAEIVDGCTDAEETPKPPWRERKENTSHIWRKPRPRSCSCPAVTNCTIHVASCPTFESLAKHCGTASEERRTARCGITARS